MKFYRVKVGDIGIYEAVDRDCPKGDSRRENKPDGGWLPKRGIDFPGAISYWTEYGWKKYRDSGLFDWHTSVVNGEITIEQIEERPKEILYEDEYQIIVPKLVKKLLTLCFVRKDDQVLLGMKKRGFGKGKWNGFGGKVEVGESLEGAARRELKEEACIEAGKLEEVGNLVFEFESEDEQLEVHVFLTDEFSGKPCETEEMRPEWFDIKELPFDQMWLDDPHWLPLVLSGKKVSGTFLFRGTEKLLKSTVEEW